MSENAAKHCASSPTLQSVHHELAFGSASCTNALIATAGLGVGNAMLHFLRCNTKSMTIPSAPNYGASADETRAEHDTMSPAHTRTTPNLGLDSAACSWRATAIAHMHTLHRECTPAPPRSWWRRLSIGRQCKHKSSCAKTALMNARSDMQKSDALTRAICAIATSFRSRGSQRPVATRLISPMQRRPRLATHNL